MFTYRLIIEYDGTHLAGFQRQDGTPVKTVQGELEAALARITKVPTPVRGASRTDAGVHALGQVVAFDLERPLPIKAFERGLNAELPRSIVVRAASEVEPGWNPKRSARGKHYRYTYWNERAPTALDRHRVWHVPLPLDLARMQAAAAHFVGTHDFESFRAADCPARHGRRTMYRAEVERQGPRVIFEVVGNAFCRNMVRIFAGTLRDVGLGRIEPESLPERILARDRTAAGMTAPPQGLVLVEVIYDDRLPPRPAGQ